MIPAWQQALFELGLVRAGVALVVLCRGALYALLGRRYRAMGDFCWVARASNVPVLQKLAYKIVLGAAASIRKTGRNWILESYLRDGASRKLADSYALTGSGPHDLFRDLIVLKAATPREKGVILLKYARTFSAVAAMLDLPRLMERYTFVLEPCWSGYCDPSVLMFLTSTHPVLVQCFTEADHRFVVELGAPFVPLHLGPADWVNTEVFVPPESTTKRYDLVMVANWAAHKRHVQLFRALQSIRDRDVRVLLFGFKWANRTAEDIRREAAQYHNDRVSIEIRENVPHEELARCLTECKVFVFLSRKEGDNKAVVEAMFADVPAIVYKHTIGGASSRINPQTGVLADDDELTEKIVYMLDHYQEFSPRAWALEHTGSKVATAVLDEALRRAVTEAGGLYTSSIVEKTNSPNLAYKEPARRAEFQADYDFILSCVRGRPPDAAEAVPRPAA
ncbi:MAG TPA: glycosyltransferase [Steroidobacteraceae bacterium]